jgi:hypothetical protein
MRQTMPQVAPRQIAPQVAAPPHVVPRQFTAPVPRSFAAPQPRLQTSPRFAAPRGDRPNVTSRGSAPRFAGPKGEERRLRSIERSNIAKQSGPKSLRNADERVRAGASERRQQAIERRQQRILERQQATGKAREPSTVGSRVATTPDRALVHRGNGARQLMLQNRVFANSAARDPAARALARATFGGRFARQFSDRWRHHRHRLHVIGWIGPVFWPYAYDDFVEYTFWPYAYDAFWPYAYDDVYEGFFGPYALGGPAYAAAPAGNAPRAVARGAARAPGSAMAQVCTGETAGLTNWPIERIAETVNPDDSQRAALEDLRQAAARAVEALRAACPDALPSTPAGRLEAMRHRLETMKQAVQIVRPALETFYQSLNDEQKASFNALDPEQTASTQSSQRDLTRVCSADATRASAPTAQIEQALRLSAEQQTALNALNSATEKAAQLLAANCSTDETLTPPGRLAAMDQRLDAMLQALDIVQPALKQFYASLSDEQKAHFNQLGARRQAAR